MIAGVVLAAGASTRMGRPKQLLDLGGRPLLQHAVDLSARCFRTSIVVLGHEAGRIERALRLPPGVHVVVNPEHARGQETSVRTGLAAAVAAGADAVCLLLGDQPLMPEALVSEVVEAFGRSGAAAVRPGSPAAPGHPVVVRADAARRALAGEFGMRELMRGRFTEFVETSLPQPADVDTPGDYEAILRHAT